MTCRFVGNVKTPSVRTQSTQAQSIKTEAIFVDASCSLKNIGLYSIIKAGLVLGFRKLFSLKSWFTFFHLVGLILKSQSVYSEAMDVERKVYVHISKTQEVHLLKKIFKNEFLYNLVYYHKGS